MGKSIQNSDSQVRYLKERLSMFLDVLDAMDPEQIDLEEIDNLLGMLDDMETKVHQFNEKNTDM
ncbi:MAG: SE1561 family protein [Bacilli bacterium]